MGREQGNNTREKVLLHYSNNLTPTVIAELVGVSDKRVYQILGRISDKGRKAKCLTCKKGMLIYRSSTKHCSTECYKASCRSKDLKEVKCDRCGKKFRTRGNRKYCKAPCNLIKGRKCKLCGKKFIRTGPGEYCSDPCINPHSHHTVLKKEVNENS
jgi:hypothetical protein